MVNHILELYGYSHDNVTNDKILKLTHDIATLDEKSNEKAMFKISHEKLLPFIFDSSGQIEQSLSL